MAKTIVVKLKKAGATFTKFSISDNFGNVLATDVSKQQLIDGLALSIEDNVTVLILTSTAVNCCNKTWNIPVSTITLPELAAITYENVNTSSVWEHLTDTTLYNSFYGCTHSYIIEYPFAYQYYDEIVQNVKDYTKAYKYLTSTTGVFNDNRRIETNDGYFNEAIVYNGQQSSGLLKLVAKPINNLASYLSYPIYNITSKTITFTKVDNFYKYNTFWNVVKDSQLPLFTSSCESLSINKVLNQDNMDYGTRSFKKATIRAKDLHIRHMLTNRTDIHLVSQFITTPSQISYL